MQAKTRAEDFLDTLCLALLIERPQKWKKAAPRSRLHMNDIEGADEAIIFSCAVL
jgi:hypothetical protein